LTSSLSPFGNGRFCLPPLKKRGKGGLEMTNRERRDMELIIIYKISPDPSLLKRGINDPSLLKRGTNDPSLLKRGINDPSLLKRGAKQEWGRTYF
jgi:hypothetical protein